MNTNLGRTEVAILTNKSGGFLPFGSVVVVDTSNAASFTTTTTPGYTAGRVGVLLDPGGVEDDAPGSVAFSGFVPKINLDGAAAIGDIVSTSTAAGEATPHSSPLITGDFAQVIGSGTSPAALLFGTPLVILSGAGVYFAPSGLTGATAASRYVGATTSGAPVSGSFLVGDFIIDRSGTIYICTVAGSPGTWTAPGGGGGGRTLIAQSTPSGVGVVSFTSIPGTFEKLSLEISARSTAAVDSVELRIAINSDTTAANYSYVQQVTNSFGLTIAAGNNFIAFTRLNGGNVPANYFGSVFVEILQYASSSFYKNLNTLGYITDSGIAAQTVGQNLMTWKDASAITQMDVSLSSGDYEAGSVLSLYGED